MESTIDMLKERRLDLLREKAEREYRQQRRAEIPGEKAALAEKLQGQKERLAGLHEVKKEELAIALEKKKQAEKAGGKEDPIFLLTLGSLKAMQKAAKDYNDTKADVDHNEKKLKDMEAEETALAEKAEEDTVCLAILPAIIEEVGTAITTAAQEIPWAEKLTAVAKKCQKQFNKAGTAYPCPGCDFFAKELGKCKVMAEWGCTPMNWHVKDMEAAVDRAYQDEKKLRALQKKRAKEAEETIRKIQGGEEETNEQGRETH